MTKIYAVIVACLVGTLAPSGFAQGAGGGGGGAGAGGGGGAGAGAGAGTVGAGGTGAIGGTVAPGGVGAVGSRGAIGGVAPGQTPGAVTGTPGTVPPAAGVGGLPGAVPPAPGVGAGAGIGTPPAGIGTPPVGGSGAIGGLPPGAGTPGTVGTPGTPGGVVTPNTGAVGGVTPGTGAVGGTTPGAGAIGGTTPGTGAVGGVGPGVGPVGDMTPGVETGIGGVRPGQVGSPGNIQTGTGGLRGAATPGVVVDNPNRDAALQRGVTTQPGVGIGESGTGSPVDLALSQRVRAQLLAPNPALGPNAGTAGAVRPETLSNVQISANGGRVLLQGTVNSEAERRLLETRISRVPGVRGVVNQLSVGGAAGQLPQTRSTGAGAFQAPASGVDRGTASPSGAVPPSR